MKQLKSIFEKIMKGGDISMNKIFAIIAIITLMAIPSVAQANLLQNPSFELTPTTTQHLPGWNLASDGGYNANNQWRVATDPPGPTAGSYYAANFYDGAMTQRVSITGGYQYRFSADTWLAQDASMASTYASTAKVQWLNSSGIQVNENVLADLAFLSRAQWNSSVATFTAPSTAVEARIALATWWDSTTTAPPNPTYWDNISFDVIPEPSSLLLLGSGIIGMLSATRKKKA